MAPRPSVRNLFSGNPNDGNAPAGPEYAPVHSPEDSGTDASDTDDDDNSILREEEEREKLLAGGIFGGLGGNGSIKIGKKVKGVRRKPKEVAEMMGGKRLGMEEGGEFGMSGSEGEEDEEELARWGEKNEAKPRKPTTRKIILFTSMLLTFLGMTIFGSLALSRDRRASAPPLVYSNGTHPYTKTTLLISLDGFRSDFLNRNLTPTLDSFVNSGVSPLYMTPSFPSVTFPNHWTLVTGLHPESHGVVGNSFWDPDLKREFYYTDPARSLQHEWWGGEPIWKTVEQQGGTAAVHMWPGSEARGCGAQHVDHFNASEVLPRKVARILEWLDLPARERPMFIAAYVPDVDESGHKFGPNTTETNDVIRSVDSMLHDLFMGLEHRNLTDIVNIVIVSDHGMASTDKSRLIYLEDLVDTSLVEHTDGWPLYGLRPYPQHNLTDIYNSILSHHKSDSHWSVYLRDVNMPARYHFSANPRIAPLWIVPEAGWTIVTKKEFPPGTKGEYHPRGLHGFDNLHPLMRSIFVARGPAFQHLHGVGKEWLGLDRHSGAIDKSKTKGPVKSGRVQVFQNTEVYRLVCDSLGLKAQPSNSTMTELKLVQDDSDDEKTSSSSSSKSESATSTKARIGIQTVPLAPERPTMIKDPLAPAVTGTPANIGISPPGAEPGKKEGEEKGKDGEKTWWELLKSKAERLKQELKGWINDFVGNKSDDKEKEDKDKKKEDKKKEDKSGK
ncbi:Phosphodiest-domain-containing protein [Wilcoxina mikolae CBS 423.85]|nr:Phosphodiest-domain-containing protein [Wilcoxina mikolae CBS 423.85]